MASITHLEHRTRTSLYSPTTVDGLRVLGQLPIAQIEGGTMDALPTGFAVVVEHGHHSRRVGFSAWSQMQGTVIVGGYDGEILITRYVGRLEKYDPDARNTCGGEGAYRDAGYDMKRVTETVDLIVRALPGLVERAVRTALKARKDRLTAQLKQFRAGEWHALDQAYDGPNPWQYDVESKAVKELAEIDAVLAVKPLNTAPLDATPLDS